jgi:hypothetical protein
MLLKLFVRDHVMAIGFNFYFMALIGIAFVVLIPRIPHISKLKESIDKLQYLTSSLLTAISISLLLTGPGRISIKSDVLKREVFPRGKHFIQNHKDQAM